MFYESFNDLYHLLDKKASTSFCKLSERGGKLDRIYVGSVNVTKSKRNCLNWMSLNTTKSQTYKTMDGIGNHNFCRNPGRAKEREFCYYSPSRTELCAVRSCGKYSLLNLRSFLCLSYINT